MSQSMNDLIRGQARRGTDGVRSHTEDEEPAAGRIGTADGGAGNDADHTLSEIGMNEILRQATGRE